MIRSKLCSDAGFKRVMRGPVYARWAQKDPLMLSGVGANAISLWQRLFAGNATGLMLQQFAEKYPQLKEQPHRYREQRL